MVDSEEYCLVALIGCRPSNLNFQVALTDLVSIEPMVII